jgi:polar amino acid transport system ATP-binding protein
MAADPGLKMSIQIKALEKYKKSEKVLDIEEISLREGDITVIVGKNGSGKSTLLKCVGGLLPFESGTINVKVLPDIDYILQGNKPADVPRQMRTKIGYISQKKALWDHLTVIENITHPLLRHHPNTRHPIELAKTLLARLKIAHKHNSFPAQLSGGEERKVAIARTLAIEPDLLLIDELEANLDQKSIKRMMRMISENFIDKNKTVLMVSHSLDLVDEFNPHIVVLDGGKVLAHEKGVTNLLAKHSANKETIKLIRDSLDSSSTKWSLANQSLEATIALSQLSLAEKDLDKLFAGMGQQLSQLISRFEPDAEHLLLIATQIKRKGREPADEIMIRSAERSQDFVLDGTEVDKLRPLVAETRGFSQGSYDFIQNHRRNLIKTRGGIKLENKAGIKGSSLMSLMFDPDPKDPPRYQCTIRHDWIEGACDISIADDGKPLPSEGERKRNSYYQFSKSTKTVYLVGCAVNQQVKCVISIDTTAKQKWPNFLIQQLMLVGNMVAIAIKNHEDSKQ